MWSSVLRKSSRTYRLPDQQNCQPMNATLAAVGSPRVSCPVNTTTGHPRGQTVDSLSQRPTKAATLWKAGIKQHRPQVRIASIGSRQYGVTERQSREVQARPTLAIVTELMDHLHTTTKKATGPTRAQRMPHQMSPRKLARDNMRAPIDRGAPSSFAYQIHVTELRARIDRTRTFLGVTTDLVKQTVTATSQTSAQ